MIDTNSKYYKSTKTKYNHAVYLKKLELSYTTTSRQIKYGNQYTYTTIVLYQFCQLSSFINKKTINTIFLMKKLIVQFLRSAKKCDTNRS